MNKEAIFDNLSPSQVLLYSILGGSGLFGGPKLIQDAYNLTQKPNKDESELSVDIPIGHNNQKQANNEIPPQLNNIGGNEDTAYKLISLLGGVPLGFLGMKGIYDVYKSDQANRQIEDEKKKYLTTLQGFKQASETPILDGFVNQYLDFFEKSAVDFNLPSLSEQNPELYNKAEQDVFTNGLLGNTSSYMTGGLSDAAKSALAAVFLLSAAGTTGALTLADKKRNETQASKVTPSKITMNPVMV